MPVSAPADKRFRRAQVKPARNRRLASVRLRRRLKAGLIGLALAVGCYEAAVFVLEAPTLRINRIEVQGNARLSTGEVLAALDGMRGQNILIVNLDRWRQRLLSSAWVGDAAIRRLLPSTIEVSIWERTPMAIGRLANQLYLIDERGVLIDEYSPRYAEFDLPIVDGLASAPSDGGPAIDERRAELAARLLEAVRGKRELARRISQIDVRDGHDAVVLLEGDPALIHVGAEQFVERLQSYLEVAPALRERVPEIDYVDLRFDQRIYVRPVGPSRPRGTGQTAGTTGRRQGPHF